MRQQIGETITTPDKTDAGSDLPAGTLTVTANACEADADAARRFAGELERLRAGLRERGITEGPGPWPIPVTEWPVTTALATIGELTGRVAHLETILKRATEALRVRRFPTMPEPPANPVATATLTGMRAELAPTEQPAEHGAYAAGTGSVAVGGDSNAPITTRVAGLSGAGE